MSTLTKNEVMSKVRRWYLTAGREHKRKLIEEAVALLEYHRKAAIRALGRAPIQRLRDSSQRGKEKRPGAAEAGWPGRLNNSSEELLTLDILRGRELRLETRPLRRSSAAWAALAQEVFKPGKEQQR